MEWSKQQYSKQKESWVPWVEDMYLRWFTNDNKASYTTKDTLGKTKVTGVDQVDTLQDGVNNLAAGQVGQGGLLQPVGDAFSKEGFNRAERQGKDDKGEYAPGYAGQAAGSLASGGKAAGGAVADGGKALGSGVKGAGGYLGGMVGGGQGKGEGAVDGQKK